MYLSYIRPVKTYMAYEKMTNRKCTQNLLTRSYGLDSVTGVAYLFIT